MLLPCKKYEEVSVSVPVVGINLILISYKAYRKKDVLKMVLSLVVIMPTSYPLPSNNID
jgi:hypothetical protein